MKDLADYGDYWHTVGAAGDEMPAYVDYVTASGTLTGAGHETLKFRKQGRHIELVGSCSINSFVDQKTIFTLPTISKHNEYKPAKRRSLVVSAMQNDGTGFPNQQMNVHIKSDGKLVVCSGSYTGSGALHLIFNHRIEL